MGLNRTYKFRPDAVRIAATHARDLSKRYTPRYLLGMFRLVLSISLVFVSLIAVFQT